MENNTPTQVSLNERVLDIIYENVEDVWQSDGILKKELYLCANIIERLVLQEKIDLLKSLWKTHVQNNKSLGVNFTEKIAELTNQLNKLPQ